MNNTTIALDQRAPLKDGTYPLKIFIKVANRKYINFRFGVSLHPNEWDGSSVVRHPQRGLLNNMLRSRLNAIDEELYKLELSGDIHRLPLDQIKRRLQNPHEVEEVRVDTRIESAFIAFSKGCKAERTRSIYLQTLTKLRASFDLKELCFADITNKWLREWENTMLQQGMSINGISVHLRNLRAVFNRAIDDEVIGQDLYPFRKFKIKTERTAKRSLSVEELRTLINYPCEPYQERYRDFFTLIFLLIGINFVDLAHLLEIKKGRVDYRRSKTARLYSVKVEPEALSIIEKYKGKKQLLNILDHSPNYHDYLARMNEGLKAIGGVEYVANSAKDPVNIKKNKKKKTPLHPQLSTYWARHTWATIAASLDTPKETIAAALGHGQNSVTDIYINFDQRKVDEANRKVIDYVFKAQ